MFRHSRQPAIPLPKAWPRSVRSAVIQVISLAQHALAYTRSWSANCPIPRIRMAADLDQANQEIALLREELRVNHTRMARIPAHQRPPYPPTERMSILELKAARGWSLKQTANAFLVTAATISSWMKRLDEEGPDALVQLRQPVNKFPDFVRYIVRRLKTLCPSMGKIQIAQILPGPACTLDRLPSDGCSKRNAVASLRRSRRARRLCRTGGHGQIRQPCLECGPDHGSDRAGYWCSWLPFALPQYWPFCYWVAIVIDHFSRRAMGVASFKSQPSSEAVRAFLGRAMHTANAKPRHLISDKGGQFWNDGFKRWCKRKGVKPRFGAVGKHGSICVVERFILTMKCLVGCLLLVPYRREAFQRELDAIMQWYNQYRGHATLGGKTPNEVYDRHYPANRKPRFEPRSRWPRGSACAKPWALVRGSPGAKLTLEVSFHAGKKHLPVVRLKRVA